MWLFLQKSHSLIPSNKCLHLFCICCVAYRDRYWALPLLPMLWPQHTLNTICRPFEIPADAKQNFITSNFRSLQWELCDPSWLPMFSSYPTHRNWHPGELVVQLTWTPSCRWLQQWTVLLSPLSPKETWMSGGCVPCCSRRLCLDRYPAWDIRSRRSSLFHGYPCHALLCMASQLFHVIFPSGASPVPGLGCGLIAKHSAQTLLFLPSLPLPFCQLS